MVGIRRMLAAFTSHCRICKTAATLNHPTYALSVVRCPRCRNVLHYAPPGAELPDTLEADRIRQGYSDRRILDVARIVVDQLAAHHRAIGPFGVLSPRRIILQGESVALLPELKLDTPFGSQDWAWEQPAYELRGFDYFAPELLLARLSSSIQADIYSLGAVISFLQMGKAPFEGCDFEECALDKQLGPINPQGNSGVNESIAALVARMTAPSPDARPQCADAVASALGDLRVDH